MPHDFSFNTRLEYCITPDITTGFYLYEIIWSQFASNTTEHYYPEIDFDRSRTSVPGINKCYGNYHSKGTSY